MIQLKRNKSHHFYIECKNDQCRHNAMVPVSALLEEYGEDITSDEILRRTRCTKCVLTKYTDATTVRAAQSKIDEISAIYQTK